MAAQNKISYQTKCNFLTGDFHFKLQKFNGKDFTTHGNCRQSSDWWRGVAVTRYEVTLHRAGLVLGWVTACVQANHLGM